MVDLILVELVQYHRLEMTPLPQRLADVVSLLPSVQAVLGRIEALLALRAFVVPVPRTEAMREIIEDAGNVIVECAA